MHGLPILPLYVRGKQDDTKDLCRTVDAHDDGNGKKLLVYDIDSNRWKAHVKTCKFFPTAYGQGNWGQAEQGHIGLQDYGGAVEFRNIKIRTLPAGSD